MPNTYRLAGRFFSVLISLVFTVLLPLNMVARAGGEAGVRSPAASRFSPWSTARRFTLAELNPRQPRLAPHGNVLASLMPAARLNAFVGSPTLCQIIEGIFGAKSGATKKAAALSFVQTAVCATDVIANKGVIDPNKFQEGLSTVIDGVVACLNASVWAKQ